MTLWPEHNVYKFGENGWKHLIPNWGVPHHFTPDPMYSMDKAVADENLLPGNREKVRDREDRPER